MVEKMVGGGVGVGVDGRWVWREILVSKILSKKTPRFGPPKSRRFRQDFRQDLGRKIFRVILESLGASCPKILCKIGKK